MLDTDAPQSRQYIAFLMWPESTEKQAYRNLRQRLFHLRKVIPDSSQFILANDKTIQWNPNSSYWLDVSQFRRLIGKAKQKKSKHEIGERASLLRSAISTYGGKLLEDCYEEWIDVAREELHEQYTWALREMVSLLESKRDYAEAIEYARKLISVAPYNEHTYQKLMGLQALNQDRAKALQTYYKCQHILEEEFNIAPSPATSALYEQIKNSNVASLLASDEIQTKSDPEKKLVGRNTEWELLVETWKKTLHDSSHLLLLSGEPGIGKTRLARELMHYVGSQGYNVAYAKSYEAGEASSYGPVISLLRSEKIRTTLNKLPPQWMAELVRLLPELIDKYPELAHPAPLTEIGQRNRLFEAITKALINEKRATLLLLDDLQWCDDETLAWLQYLLHSALHRKVLVVGLMRPIEAAANRRLKLVLQSIRSEGMSSQILLEKLSRAETIALACQEAHRQLKPEMAQYICDETGGNPLFIIETVREGHLARSADGLGKPGVYERALPKKIVEVITAR